MALSGVVPVVNKSGEVIPPRAVMAFDGTADAQGLLGVVKPAADDATAVLFNGPTAIDIGQVGQGYHPFPRAVASLELTDLPLSADGLTFGVRAGQWRLRPTGRGFKAVTPVFAGDITVVPDANPGAAPGMFVKLTAQGATKFAFAQWAVDASGPVVVAGGVTGTTTVGYARDIGGVSYAGLIGTFQYLTPNPLIPGTWLFDAKLCSTFEAVTDESISLCVVTITYTTFQLLPSPKTTVALSTRTTTISIPNACVNVLTDVTVAMSCVSNAPVATVTKTFTKVRVLDCGTCP